MCFFHRRKCAMGYTPAFLSVFPLKVLVTSSLAAFSGLFIGISPVFITSEFLLLSLSWLTSCLMECINKLLICVFLFVLYFVTRLRRTFRFADCLWYSGLSFNCCERCPSLCDQSLWNNHTHWEKCNTDNKEKITVWLVNSWFLILILKSKKKNLAES